MLCLCSPVLHKMVCGGFKECSEKKLELRDVDARTFIKVFDLWCGRDTMHGMCPNELWRLASVADRLQITELLALLEEAIMGQLTFDNCAELLGWSSTIRMPQLEDAARRLARSRFEELAGTAGFAMMEEEALGCLLDDNELVATWEAVAGWMKAGGAALRGHGLLGKIRFGLMDDGYLTSNAVGQLPAADAELIQGLVTEALAARAVRVALARAPFSGMMLGGLPAGRVGWGVDWAAYAAGGDRLQLLYGPVLKLEACAGRMCCGFRSVIRVWNLATGELERALPAAGEMGDDRVRTLAACGGHLISGHSLGTLRVWNVLTGECEQAFQGHAQCVLALAVCGPSLVSGSADGCVRVWAMGTATPWACERALVGHTASAITVALAAWRGKAVGGTADGRVVVWDVATGARDAVLAHHTRCVGALLVRADRLFSASRDGTIREWAAGTWAALRVVEAFGPRAEPDETADEYPICLAASGSKLVSGSTAGVGKLGNSARVRVWDLASLQREATLVQPARDSVSALAAVDEAVWAGVGEAVVTWGRPGLRLGPRDG